MVKSFCAAPRGRKPLLLFAVGIAALMAIGVFQSWTLSLTVLNYCTISAVFAIGANVQWGYGGILNFAGAGFAALGGLVAMLVAAPTEPTSNP